jgi:drug/metabolite transporter (DMT)-like permease
MLNNRVFGLSLIFLFVLSTSFRDVYFSGVFQGVSFFLITLISFSICTLIFIGITVVKSLNQLIFLFKDWRSLFLMNVTTAIGWILYFFALKNLEPSVVNTIWSGVGPITIGVLSSVGINIANPVPIKLVERLCHTGIFVSLILLAGVVLVNLSGIPTTNTFEGAISLITTVLSSVSITVSILFSKRMNENGITAETVVAVRFLLTVVISAIAVLTNNEPTGVISSQQVLDLSLAAILLIVLPTYIFQMGIAITAPITAELISTLGPILVFGLQVIDGRITFSGYSLVCILLYSLFAIMSILTHNWKYN